ncbi:MAG: hypothetical protein KF868_06820 [Acidobacteria bacterium]|nr:hypothetical protein [Acidobacteriota bacterium]
MKSQSQSLPRTAAASIALLVTLYLVIYPLRLDSVIGPLVDDAWYVLLGKALASGEGYTLINAPTPGIRPIAPPAFPAVLAVVWLLHGEFPANLWLFKAVSMAAMAGVGVVAFLYFRRHRGLSFHLALGIAGAAVFYPALVFMATATVMSECFFTLVQLAAIAAVERCAQADEDKNHGTLRCAAISGALVTLAFLTRSAGAGLIPASILYLLWMRRRSQALALAVIVALGAGSWVVYSRVHAPTHEQRLEQASSMIRPYTEQFWQRMAGNPASGLITARELPARVWSNLSEIVRHDAGAVAFYGVFRAIEPGRIVYLNRAQVWCSILFALLILLGYAAEARRRATFLEFVFPLSLSISVLWGWEQFRFLLPLIPFLIFYLLMGLRAVYVFFARYSAGLDESAIQRRLAAVAWFVLAVNVFYNFQFIQKRYAPAPGEEVKWHSTFVENEAMLREADARIERDAVVATTIPPLVYLFTGRKTVSMEYPYSEEEKWKRAGVRYLVLLSTEVLPPPPVETRHRVVYRHPGRLGLRIIDLAAP